MDIRGGGGEIYLIVTVYWFTLHSYLDFFQRSNLGNWNDVNWVYFQIAFFLQIAECFEGLEESFSMHGSFKATKLAL